MQSTPDNYNDTIRTDCDDETKDLVKKFGIVRVLQSLRLNAYSKTDTTYLTKRKARYTVLSQNLRSAIDDYMSSLNSKG